MKLDLNCIICNVDQAIKIMDLFNVERSKREEMMREVLKYLSNADYSKCNPEVIGGTWDIILKYIESDNPYSDLKKYYNIEVLKMTDEIENLIENSDNKFNTVLKIAISGNLIDFAAKHKFDLEMLVVLIGRFVISPLSVLLFCHLFSAPLMMKNVFIIQAGLPIMTQTAIITKAYGADHKYGATMVAVTTLASMFIIPIYMLLLS
jgi:uncharacterized protein with ATP-grasp and redox domains